MISYKDKRYICALDLGFEQIRGKWKAVILCHLDEGPKRFLALQHMTGGISQKVLNESLREMEEEQLIHRKVYPEIPPRVEYSLTDLGRSIRPILFGMYDWGADYLTREGKAVHCSMTATRNVAK